MYKMTPEERKRAKDKSGNLLTEARGVSGRALQGGGIGRALFAKHLVGQSLGHAPAIKAKCYECTNEFGDGLIDCEIPGCPLHPFMPYKGVLADRGIE